MKKLFVCLSFALASISFCYGENQASKLAVQVNLNIAESVDAVKNAIPNAEYILQIWKGNDVAYSGVSSCAEAKMKAYELLRKGADEITISSIYPTVHSSCSGKTYTQSNKEDLR